MNSKHTPSPWTVHTCEVHPHHEIVAGNGRRIATQNDYHDGQDKANALLIAAAPDMLGALQSLFNECAMVHKHWGDGDNQKQADAAIEFARAAILKATEVENHE